MLSLLMTVLASSLAFCQTPGKVASLEGQAWVMRSEKRVPLSAGSQVAEGDRLFTGPNSHLILLFPHAAAIRVNAGAEVLLRKAAGSEYDLLLMNGSALSTVDKATHPRFRMRTP